MTLSLKGVAVRAGLRWVAEKHGMQAVEGVYARSSTQLRSIIVPGLSSFGIVSSSWYEATLIGELLDVIVHVTKAPNDGREALAGMAEAIARDNLKGVYQSLFRLIATRPQLIAHGQRVWRSYYNDGTLTVTSEREGELLFSVSETREHHLRLCVMTSLVLEQILEKIGYSGASLTRLSCIDKGARACTFEVDYIAK